MTGVSQPIRVLVTRPEQQAEQLCQLIIRHGWQPIRFPVLQLKAIEQNLDTALAVGKLNQYHWLIFVSANAVKFVPAGFQNAFNERVRIAAVGKATAAALRAAGMPVDLLPEQEFNSEALLATPEMRQVNGLTCLIVRGQNGRELLAEKLTERGAQVEYLEVYRRTKPELERSKIVYLLTKHKLDIITATSSEAVQNLLELSGEKIAKVLKLIPLVVISDRIRKKAENLGFKQTVVADEPSDTAIVSAIMTLLNGE